MHSHGGYLPARSEGDVDGYSFSFRERDGYWDIEIDLRPSGRFMRVVDGENGVLPVTEDDDEAVTVDGDEDWGVGRQLDGVIGAVTASSAW